MRRLVVLVLILIGILVAWNAISNSTDKLPALFQRPQTGVPQSEISIVKEESVVIDIVKKVGPSVVTVSADLPRVSQSPFNFGPYFFDVPEEENSREPQDIGSGFIVTADGLIVTNKHVVSDPNTKYHVITSDDKQYDVQRIYRDPLNDVAILKISASGLKAVELGDSSKLQVGQFAIAIGTALGEFRNTVTTGVISGLGRGITAGRPLQGVSEEFSNVIQTDAAINPGNSGGPLLNSAGQVIGVNSAIAASGQNIGFALPINIIKESIENFNQTGQFDRPYLGVGYQLISQEAALRNEVPQGALVTQVIENSAADKAGIQRGDIITHFDGTRVNIELALLISKKKIGDAVRLTVFRDGKTMDITATLEAVPSQ